MGKLRSCSIFIIAQLQTLPNPASCPSSLGVHTKSMQGTLTCSKQPPWSRGYEVSGSRRSRRVGSYQEQEQAASRSKTIRERTGGHTSPVRSQQGEVVCLLCSGKLHSRGESPGPAGEAWLRGRSPGQAETWPTPSQTCQQEPTSCPTCQGASIFVGLTSSWAATHLVRPAPHSSTPPLPNTSTTSPQAQ